MDEICERSERATENKKKCFGGNFKFSGCGLLVIVNNQHSKLTTAQMFLFLRYNLDY